MKQRPRKFLIIGQQHTITNHGINHYMAKPGDEVTLISDEHTFIYATFKGHDAAYSMHDVKEVPNKVRMKDLYEV